MNVNARIDGEELDTVMRDIGRAARSAG